MYLFNPVNNNTTTTMLFFFRINREPLWVWGRWKSKKLRPTLKVEWNKSILLRKFFYRSALENTSILVTSNYYNGYKEINRIWILQRWLFKEEKFSVKKRSYLFVFQINSNIDKRTNIQILCELEQLYSTTVGDMTWNKYVWFLNDCSTISNCKWIKHLTILLKSQKCLIFTWGKGIPNLTRMKHFYSVVLI